jgi:hypothetical protein
VDALGLAIALAPDAKRHTLGREHARLDLDDPRAHVREQHRAHRHGDDLAQVEDRYVVEGALHVLLRRKIECEECDTGPRGDFFCVCAAASEAVGCFRRRFAQRAGTPPPLL